MNAPQPPTYEATRTWQELTALKVRMQRDLLSMAIREGASRTDAARIADMERAHFLNTCRRLGVDILTGEVAS